MMMTLEAIGQKLKAAREAQGLSLRQIYERTKIPINHLQSIDGGMPDDLPEPVYVAGFIKRYAECIGLDGQVLADEYRRREETGENGNGNGRSRSKQALAQQVYVTPEYLKHTRIDQAPPSWKMWPFYALAVIGVVALVSLYSSHTSQVQPDPNVLSLKDASSQLQAQQNALTAPTGAAATNAPPTPPPSDKVVLNVARHVWVEVKRLSTGDPIYTGSLEKGDSREFQDSQGLRIRVGDGGSLSVEAKGKIEPFGQSGRPSERTFDTHSTVAATPGADASATAGQTTSSTAGSAASTTGIVKPRKVVRKPSDTTTVVRRRRLDDGGFRSIGGDSGTRSLDVPYRYSEGRLDAN
jgi:cytoskeletal protein RodZ